MRAISVLSPATLLQIGAIGVGLTLFAFRTPDTGRILLVPYDGSGDVAPTLRVALAHGASIVAKGPFPGSMVVQGSAADLSAAARRAHLLMMAAPPAGCGAMVSTSDIK